MPKLGSYDSPDLIGVIEKVYVQMLGEYLTERHGDKAPEIMEKFSNLERDHVIIVATIAETEVDGFFMIPGLTGWSKSNLKSFIQINGLDSEVDTDVQEDLDRWVGHTVQGVMDKTDKGSFLRLAK